MRTGWPQVNGVEDVFVERPPYEILEFEAKELGYAGIGRKCGVSDNTVRK